MPLDDVDDGICLAFFRRGGGIWSGEDIIKLQVNFSEKSSNSTEYLEMWGGFSDVLVSKFDWTEGPVMADIRLPRMYIPPATAAVRQKP